MKRGAFILLAGLLGLAGVRQFSTAQDGPPRPIPSAPEGPPGTRATSPALSMPTGARVISTVPTGQSAVGQIPAVQEGPPSCPAGCKVIEEIINQEVCSYCQKVVPLMKTRWVYDWVDDPFCVPHNPHCGAGLGHLCKHHCQDGHCQSCEFNGDIRCRKQLVKKPIEECVGQQCVVEKITTIVPCKVYRIVPCNGVSGPSAEPIPAPKVVVPDPKK
jgi:hypothetical protein